MCCKCNPVCSLSGWDLGAKQGCGSDGAAKLMNVKWRAGTSNGLASHILGIWETQLLQTLGEPHLRYMGDVASSNGWANCISGI